MAEWHETLPDDLKESGTLLKYETPEAAYKGLIEASAMIGNSIRVPGKDAGTQDRQSFYEKLVTAAPHLQPKPDYSDEERTKETLAVLGVPTEAGKYDCEGIDMPDEILNSLKQNALVSEMTPRQFNKYIKQWDEDYVEEQKALKENTEATEQELKNLWGAAYDSRMAQNKTLEKQFGDESLNGENARQVMLHNIVLQLTGKGSQAGLQPFAPETGQSPQDALAEMKEIRTKLSSTKEEDQMDYKERQRLIKRLPELQVLAHPEKYAQG